MAPTVRPEKKNCSSSGIGISLSLPARGAELGPRARQGPVPVPDLQHAECRKIESEMVCRRHVDDAAGADKAPGLLDLVAHLAFVGALGALHRLDQDHQSVIHVSPEG